MNSINNRNNIYICVGAGGVGKTTVASVLGLHFALMGKRTLIITVDPAQRLLDALSLKNKSAEPSRVNLTALTKMTPAKGGELYAFMPNLKQEWMDFLQAAINQKELRHKIAANHFYQYMAAGLPGAFEIICSHIMFRLISEDKYDCIVLDTPPTSHSLSFFDVPKKISKVLEQNIFRMLMHSRNSVLLKIAKKFAFFSGGLLEKTIERLIGSHFLSELIDFALTIDGLYAPLLQRVKAMDDLLKDKQTQYVLVLRPTSASINDVFNLKSALNKRDIYIDQIVANQVIKTFDKEAISDEILQMTKASNIGELTGIKHWISLYKEQLNFEQQLLEKVFRQFNVANKYVLNLCQTKSDQQNMLIMLLQDYQEQALA